MLLSSWETLARYHAVAPSSWNLRKSVSKLSRSTWILGITVVSPTVQCSWNVYKPVRPSVLIKWNLVDRRSNSYVIYFNVLNSVSVDGTIKWNIGLPVQSQIRQTSFPRTDFTY